METPEAVILSRLPWQVFGSLTFKPRDEGMSTRRQRVMFFAFVRKIAEYSGMYFPDFQWVLRMERGEKFGREHLHCLLGDPLEPTSKTDRFAMMALWEKLGGGMTRLREYETRQSGVDYVCKCLGGESSGANAYELNKFGSAGELTLSHAATAAIHSRNWATGLRVAKAR